MQRIEELQYVVDLGAQDLPVFMNFLLSLMCKHSITYLSKSSYLPPETTN